MLTVFFKSADKAEAAAARLIESGSYAYWQLRVVKLPGTKTWMIARMMGDMEVGQIRRDDLK